MKEQEPDSHKTPERTGFMLHLIKTALFKLTGNNTLLENTVRQCICSVAQEQFHATHCMVIFKNPKTGLEDVTFLHHENGLISLDELSRIKADLEDQRMYFPAFFIYIHESPQQSMPHKAFLDAVGQRLGAELSQILRRSLDQELHE